ncbi:YadA family autotransporter adhesin [Paraburkholderia oxyphila]|uniref:YadA family autotransporter adhesin n=1 Tax=Paraburkholderia oxyphila TaxID=614212 RepID=UPI00047F945C|nr:YadA-like family protein [Paraburkholderia oxyphila]
MNKVYRSVYNKVLGTWVAASELTAARGKPARAKSGVVLVAGVLLASAGAMSDLAQASVAISDNGSKSVQSGPASMSASSGGIGASASANSIAIVGDGDCNLLTNVDAQKVYGDGAANNYKGGIYGFGVQTSAASYDDLSNAGAGQSGMKGYSSMTAGYVTESGNGVASTQAFGQNSIAMGCGAHANGFGTVAQGWGAVANGAGAVAYGINAVANGQGSFASGIAADAEGDDSIALGTLASATGNGSIALGANTVAAGENAVASGNGASAEGDESVAMGSSASASGANALAFGANALASGENALASGIGASATADNTIALGSQAMASGIGALAFGMNASASTANSVALGANATASAANAVALGANSVADRADSVSVGAAGSERQITNVAAGTADTDAANVSQLKNSGLIAADGTANVAVTYDKNADGTSDYSNLTLGNGVAGGTTIHNVAAGVADTDAVNVGQLNSAVDNLNTAVNNAQSAAESAYNPFIAAYGDRSTEGAVASGVYSAAVGANANASGTNTVAFGANANASGAGSAAFGANAVASADNSVALGANSVANRANTVSVGSAGSERQVTNVAAGTEGTDAVNVNQLVAAQQQAESYADSKMSQMTQGLSSLQDSISDVQRKAYAGTAAAMAVAGLPQPTQPGKIMVAMAGGRYGGQTGGALGFSYVTENNKWVGKVAANTSTQGNTGVVVGAGYQW